VCFPVALTRGTFSIAVTSYQGGHIEFFKYMIDLMREAEADEIKQNLAQDDCRYPPLIQIRKATNKRWDIISVAKLRRSSRRHKMAPQSRATSLTG
jgi:methylmalonyl-CoA mutase cobalamin-binding subunit